MGISDDSLEVSKHAVLLLHAHATSTMYALFSQHFVLAQQEETTLTTEVYRSIVLIIIITTEVGV